MLAGDPFNKEPIAHNAAEFICQVRSDFKKSLVSTGVNGVDCSADPSSAGSGQLQLSAGLSIRFEDCFPFPILVSLVSYS